MSDMDFDKTLVNAAFRLAGEQGWAAVNVTTAARAAGLSLAEARERFPSTAAILLRFGRLADQAALADAPSEGPVRDRLFDLLMRRFDVLQNHREGVRALLRSLPADPATALMLASATQRSMRWMLQAAGEPATGPRGELQVRGLMAVWLWAMRAWDRDDSPDLSGTMAAIDTTLQRAERVASWLHGRRSDPPPPPPVSAGAGELDPAAPPSASPEAPPLPTSMPPTSTPPTYTPPISPPPISTPPAAVPPPSMPPTSDPPPPAPPSVSTLPPVPLPPPDDTLPLPDPKV